MATTILRFFNAIGRNETNPHVVPHIFESLQTSDVIHLGNMAPRRDYIDTRDVAEAILSVADGAQGLNVFNVGTGRETSVNRLHEHCRDVAGSTELPEHCPPRPGEARRSVLDASLATRELGWHAQVNLEEGLRKTWEE